MKIEKGHKTYCTFDLGNFGKYRMTAYFYGEEIVYECRIGKGGNWTVTDSQGYRYVPFSFEDEPSASDFEDFGGHSYVIITPTGTVGYLVGVEKL
jgi:hypothetical protein